ncbi:MAG: hypothetical protein M0C28_25265 [Candidatus Moduliflexus flocculans]|nr:hypothetical protein [Candidatus Moduliflexus flocculans]
MTDRRAAFRRLIPALLAAAVSAVLILFAARGPPRPPPAAAEEMALDNGRAQGRVQRPRPRLRSPRRKTGRPAHVLRRSRPR